ncbi:MAG: T9SS type A sorting domain-containing protein, partial [Bacteroidota bacterium]|nr:T9SS type A sorting domain-containing protein [Bacteroidota bacterium]
QAEMNNASGKEIMLAKEIPETFSIGSYPNPFNPTTVINYALPENAQVELKVFNTLGQEVAALVNEVQEAGYKTVRFDANNLPSGVYYYRLVANAIPSGQAGSFVQTKKLMLIR